MTIFSLHSQKKKYLHGNKKEFIKCLQGDHPTLQAIGYFYRKQQEGGDEVVQLYSK
jgi:hypothetical protein